MTSDVVDCTTPGKEAGVAFPEADVPAHADKVDADVKSRDERDLWKFTACVCWFQFFISGIFYGISPLALPISSAFARDGDTASSEYGLVFYGFAILMAFNAGASCVAIFWIHHMSVSAKARFITGAYCAWPLAWIALAVGVQLRSSMLLWVICFPLLGISIGVEVGYVYLVLISIMWGEKVHVGASLGGGFSALGALCWNFIFGETIHGLGFQRVHIAMWIFCGLHATGALIGVAFFNPTKYLRDEPGSSESQKSASKGMTMLRLLRDWRVCVVVFIVQAFFFSGLTMKTLMSELFEKLLQLEYIKAVRYSGGCLAAYVVARFIAPLVGSGKRVFALHVIVLVTEGVAYALTPWAVRLEHRTEIIYTSFRLVGGVGFAMLKSSTSVLLVHVFGSENVANICGMFLVTDLVIGLGPSIAFTLHVKEVQVGTPSHQSYDPFFYLCSGLVLAASVGVLALRWDAGRPSSCSPSAVGSARSPVASDPGTCSIESVEEFSI
eukprot:TRINITY_DN71209_c0_g1_i1.p1 TRINITY_DN71209_c0_g1~~TRINITY_DN71209_c0_g1_i1.p1  ORF type:complete len:497 (+),score=48.99 TRINITY_DN71209_c0_g1_i1:156-1646(+)